MTLEPDGSIPVTMQDQHTPAIISPLFRTLATTTLSDPFPVEATEIFVTSGTGIVVGSHLVLTDPTSGAFHICDATAVDGLVIGIDTPLAFPFTAGSNIEVGTHNIGLANGTPGSPVLYHARVSTGAPISFDVTRVMFLAETTGVGDLSQFGDLTALANGIVLRKNNGDGTFQSIFNAKSNGDMKGMMFDFDILSATNPQQGQNGFAGRLTFAGQNKMGVTIRLEPGTDLELLVQDNLTGLETFRIIAEGSVVQD
jgi:hypothetical protein